MRKWRAWQGGLGRAPKPALRFHEHEDGHLFSACEDASGEATALVQPRRDLPGARSPGGIRDRPARVQANEERGEGGPGRDPLRVREIQRSRAEDGAEGEPDRQGHGARDPAGVMASASIRVSLCAGSFGEPVF